MEDPIELRVSAAERMSGGLLITFGNGKCAIYSAALLYSIFDQAKEVIEEEEDIER